MASSSAARSISPELQRFSADLDSAFGSSGDAAAPSSMSSVVEQASAGVSVPLAARDLPRLPEPPRHRAVWPRTSFLRRKPSGSTVRAASAMAVSSDAPQAAAALLAATPAAQRRQRRAASFGGVLGAHDAADDEGASRAAQMMATRCMDERYV
jgi:hypothetical protein